MKFICTADWHIRKDPPKYRIDNYFESLLEKVEFLVKTANRENATILIAGDVFDSPRLGYSVVNELTNVLQKAEQTPIACFGNHDTTFHSQDIRNTPFANLVVNGNLIWDKHYLVLDNTDESVGIGFLNWEGVFDIELIADVNILLGHIPVFEKEVPFWSKDGHTAKSIKKLYPAFDWYVTGDIHIPFVDGTLINPGSLSRSTIDQVDYRPGYYLLDTKKETVVRKDIPIKKPDDVFNFSQKDLDQLKDIKSLNEFIHAIKYSGDRPNFRNVLNHVVKETNATKPVINIINDILEEV